MAKEKAQKTNAMRILDRAKVSYRVNYYECDEFIDGVHIANQLSQPLDSTFKTLVATGKSGAYYVFVIPVAETLDLKKAAKAVGEKSVELLHVKDIRAVTGYIRGGCTPIGMKKQYPTVLHTSAMRFEEIILSGGCLGAQIFLAPADLVRVTHALVTDLLMENGA
ncbi:MAG: Cys-tRNA(Pro) deacylase [Clostridia bacterium]|nr:Cys-tRNA(Pro) deacylase [Clostridia bacterium]